VHFLKTSDSVFYPKTKTVLNKIILILICFSGISFSHTLLAQNNKKKPVEVRALYLPNAVLTDSVLVEHFIKLAEHSAINAYVIDIKGIDGKVNYESKITEVRNAKAWKKEYDMSKLVKKFHQHHIHVIGRIACFNDPYLPLQKPKWTIKDSEGKIYHHAKGETWLNPVNKNVWKYLVDIAKESSTKGFDEIQFDYVRFPFERDSNALQFGEKIIERYKVIDDFLAYARKEMPQQILSADVFGIICESVNDPEQIGQNLEYVGINLDYISPMIYPSLYAKGQIVNSESFPKPDLNPYGIVFQSLTSAKNRISKVKNYRAKLRPYLQAYTASWLNKDDYQPYGAKQIREQIKAVEDAGCSQWIFWNENGNYPDDAF
jgi:hypothetical protein